MAHSPDWHVLDGSFPEADVGLEVPGRVLNIGGARLAIENLDRSDPPGYTAGGVPRGEHFNANVFRLTAAPCLPAIAVQCAVSGFDPAQTPILWRLVCRHVLCRYENAGSFRYRGACEVFEREWRGESRGSSFALFDDDCVYTYNDATRVLGGHALLGVAAVLPAGTLRDLVHLRIAGCNPGREDVLSYLDNQLAGFDWHLVRMVRAIFAHESNFTQFAAHAQRAASMTFRAPHHRRDPEQPDCRVRFDWPDDPPDFPLASYDFGVGISQFTRVGGQRVSAEVAWDWRENIRIGTNLFLGKLRREFRDGMSWQQWALAGWRAYNGSGPAAAAYAQRLAASEEGAQIPPTRVGAPPQVALLAPPPPLDVPAPWSAA